MGLLAIVISILAVIFTTVTLGINCTLVYKTFVSKTIKKSSNLTLFYLRFSLDGLMSFASLLILLFYSFRLSNIQTILDSDPTIVFYINWPSAILLATRGILVIIITLDRTIAVFFPVLHHNNRNKFSLLIVIFLLIGYAGFENYMLWIQCQFAVYVPPGCINLWCFMNQCFIDFFLESELISHAIIALLSLVLALKLLIWNKCSKNSSKSLTRANRLVLIDAFITMIFDIIPAALMTKIYTGKFEDIGPVIALTKMSGYALEGYLVYGTLRRIGRNETNVKSVSNIRVKPSHG